LTLTKPEREIIVNGESINWKEKEWERFEPREKLSHFLLCYLVLMCNLVFLYSSFVKPIYIKCVCIIWQFNCTIDNCIVYANDKFISYIYGTIIIFYSWRVLVTRETSTVCNQIILECFIVGVCAQILKHTGHRTRKMNFVPNGTNFPCSSSI
jgi:hypothetical protein